MIEEFIKWLLENVRGFTTGESMNPFNPDQWYYELTVDSQVWRDKMTEYRIDWDRLVEDKRQEFKDRNN